MSNVIQPEISVVGNSLLRLLKRYHFWLLQKGPNMTEFRLQMLELKQQSWVQDCLRYIHQQAVKSKTVDDAMDYHWHSYHVYNGFWSANWLDTDFIINKYSSNRLAAMNRFRQYMQHPHGLDFDLLLESNDCSVDYMTTPNQQKSTHSKQVVAEINSQYHQSMFDRTRIRYITKNGLQYIRVTVLEQELSDNDRLECG